MRSTWRNGKAPAQGSTKKSYTNPDKWEADFSKVTKLAARSRENACKQSEKNYSYKRRRSPKYKEQFS